MSAIATVLTHPVTRETAAIPNQDRQDAGPDAPLARINARPTARHQSLYFEQREDGSVALFGRTWAPEITVTSALVRGASPQVLRFDASTGRLAVFVANGRAVYACKGSNPPDGWDLAEFLLVECEGPF